MKYLVQIKEILIRTELVEADNEFEAKKRIESLYRKSKIVLDDKNYAGYSITSYSLPTETK